MKATPSALEDRPALGRGARRGPAAGSAQLPEEQRRLARRRLRRIRPVHHVLTRLDRKVPADRARRRLQRIRRPDHLPRRPHRIDALQHHRHQRARGDEVHELPEERPLRVLGVVALGQLPLDRHVAQRHDAQPLALEARDDLARQRASEGVRLYKDQRAVHGFLCGRETDL